MSHNATSIDQQISSTRTVFDILWSCLFVIFTCTWTVQHLNVPEQREGNDPGWRGDIKWDWKSVWESAKWMCITILAPEALVTLNLGQLIQAWQSMAQLKQFAEWDNVPWTLTHSLFANMGGFVIRENAPERPIDYLRSKAGSEVKEGLKPGEQEIISSTEAIQIDEVTSPSMQEQANEGRRTQLKLAKSKFLQAHEIINLREHGVIRLPYITREEIMDKGKSDIFARILAIGQTLWLVVQMIVRASRHLEVSQLEIGTAAFASCAVTIYALTWHKPKGVGVPWTIFSYPGTIPKEFSTLLNFESVSNEWWVLVNVKPRRSGRTEQRVLRGSSIPNHHRYGRGSRGDDYLMAADYTYFYELVGFFLSSTAFGAIHFAAVKSTFPSHIEWVLWYMASGICTGVSLLVISAIVVSVLYERIHNGYLGNFGEHGLLGYRLAVTCCIVPLYIIARLFLIVELFRGLFFLPPSAFVATWVSSIPHVS
ncbi:hypothetical protein BGZ57DRAFT_866373 [Hyaloscypha finlandica]|nr:hypothetical protein BGZ57DRAFT_866373 [Hyaloscypha finlandica]